MAFLSKKKKAEIKLETDALVKKHQIDENAIDWESSKLQLLRKSERKAWSFARFFMLSSLLLFVLLLFLIPLKEKVPYVIRVDESTGLASILQIEDLQNVPASAVMDRYWLNTYVIARESYNFNQLSEDYRVVQELSLPEAFKTYGNLYNQRDGLQFTYKDKTEITVRITSITLGEPGIATLRFDKTIAALNSSIPPRSERWIVQIAYKYIPDIEMTEQRRLVNPFGFKVVNYRASREF